MVWLSKHVWTRLVLGVMLLFFLFVGFVILAELSRDAKMIDRKRKVWAEYRRTHECHEIARTQTIVRWKCRYGVIIERSVDG